MADILISSPRVGDLVYTSFSCHYLVRIAHLSFSYWDFLTLWLFEWILCMQVIATASEEWILMEKRLSNTVLRYITMFCIKWDWWTLNYNLKHTISHWHRCILNSSVVYDHHQPHPTQNMNSDSEQGSDFLLKEEIKLGTKSRRVKNKEKQKQKKKTDNKGNCTQHINQTTGCSNDNLKKKQSNKNKQNSVKQHSDTWGSTYFVSNCHTICESCLKDSW